MIEQLIDKINTIIEKSCKDVYDIDDIRTIVDRILTEFNMQNEILGYKIEAVNIYGDSKIAVNYKIKLDFINIHHVRYLIGGKAQDQGNDFEL